MNLKFQKVYFLLFFFSVVKLKLFFKKLVVSQSRSQSFNLWDGWLLDWDCLPPPLPTPSCCITGRASRWQVAGGLRTRPHSGRQCQPTGSSCRGLHQIVRVEALRGISAIERNLSK